MYSTGHAITPPATPAVRLNAVERIALAIMAFSLAALNGVPSILSCGVPCMAATLLLLLNYIRINGVSFALPKSSGPILAVWALWVFLAILSAVANFELVTITTAFWSYVLPLAMLVVVLTTRPSIDDLKFVLAVLIAGWLLRFGYGALVFQQTLGFNSLEQVLAAHFYLDGFRPYATATYGSTGRTLALIVPAMICVALAFFFVKVRPAFKVLIVAALLIIAANALITGSRALFLVVSAVLLVSGLKSSMRGGVVIVALVGGVAALFFSSLDLETQNRFANLFSTNRYLDNSVRERWESIDEGVEIMMSHVLGIGPGRSSEVLFHSVSHQFAVFQGSEMGVLGLITVVVLYILTGWKFLTTSVATAAGLVFVFWASAFGWFSLAMLANSPVGSGPNMPWVGLFAFLWALGEVAPRGVEPRKLAPQAPGH